MRYFLENLIKINNKIQTILLNMRFRSQLLLSFVILALSVMLLTASSFNILMKTTILNQNERKLNTMAGQIAQNTDSRMLQYKELTQQLYSNRIFSQQLQISNSGNQMDTYQFISDYLFSMLYGNRSSIERIIIYENGDVLFKDYDIIFPMDDLLRTKIYDSMWADVENYKLKDTWKDNRGQRVFSIYSRIPTTMLKTQGLIELRIYETELYSLIHKESREYNIYIVSHAGIIMSATDRTIIGMHRDDLGEFHQAILGITEHNSNILFEESEYVVALHETQHGYIIASIELTKLLKEFYVLSRSLLLVFLMAFLLAITLSVLLSNRLDKRMHLLNKKIQLLRMGDFEQRVTIPGDDEFSVLGLAIDHTIVDLKELIREIKHTSEEKRLAEMSALRSQINTHFLFNTLSTIKWLAVSYNAEDIKNAIEVLSSFLRITLSREGDFISVEEEIEHLKAYVYLQKLRYGNDIYVDFEIHKEAMHYKTVRLVLQPMVENAIFHGRKQDGSILNILIKLYIQDEYLYFEISDDGRGMSFERLNEVESGTAKSKYSGYGLSNIDQRMRMCCGEQFKLSIDSKESVGTRILMKQPLLPIREG